MEEKRLRKVEISVKILTEMMTKNWCVGANRIIKCIEGLPDNVEFEYSYVDDEKDVVYLVYSHWSFDPVPYVSSSFGLSQTEVYKLIEDAIPLQQVTCREFVDAEHAEGLRDMRRERH